MYLQQPLKTFTMLTARDKKLIILQFFAYSFLLLFSPAVFAQVTATDISPKILRIANKLQKDEMIHFGYAVGYTGRRETNNRYFKLYNRLKSKATNKELVELTNSKSKTIVVYAFNILCSRNYDGLKNIFLDHLSDTSWFWTAGGCTGFVDRINWFMLRRLKPTSNNADKNFLTKNEYDLYCNRFKQEDKLFISD